MNKICEEIVRLLREKRQRVVFAESCTAGLLSATLAQVPGVSEFLCGSAVTYRNLTKREWLNIPPALLDTPGPVSEIVTRHMAEHVLQRTPEAHIAVSITGHLGPDAPEELDGVIYVGTAQRGHDGIPAARVIQGRLKSSLRVPRQQEAAEQALQVLQSLLLE